MHLARVGHEPSLWARDGALVADMRRRRANAVYLPDVRFPDGVSVTSDLEQALRDAELVVWAVPSHGTRDVLRQAALAIRHGAIVVSATKGIEQGALFRVSEIIGQELGGRVKVAVLSGPSFAAELARELPTAVSVASGDSDVVAQLVDATGHVRGSQSSGCCQQSETNVAHVRFGYSERSVAARDDHLEHAVGFESAPRDQHQCGTIRGHLANRGRRGANGSQCGTLERLVRRRWQR